MVGYVFYEDKKLPYTIVTNKKLKNLYIALDPINGVIVKNPNFPLTKVYEIVQKKAKWIFEKSQFIKDKKSIKIIWEEENKILLFGNKESLHVKKDLATFYKNKSIEIIPSLVNKCSEKTNLFPSNITFRKTKRRWGSCNGKNEINFTSSIVQLPIHCIEYIIMHELAHITHKNHQKKYWELVAKFMPEYKIYEEEIKHYSPQI